MFVKNISKLMPAEFQGANRFNDELKSEWHIISTAHPDHIGDVMEYMPILPPSGKAIALLNHDPEWTGGLPLGKVLEYRVINGDDGVAQLWQHTQYLPNLPEDIGMKCYEVRKMGAFVDSSVQFMADEGGYEPVVREDIGKPRWEWSGTKYLAGKWSLLEAGPVLMGMNWQTGDMKAMRKSLFDTVNKCLKDGPEAWAETARRNRESLEPHIRIIGEPRLAIVTGEPVITIIN
jgi:hypothetical protein